MTLVRAPDCRHLDPLEAARRWNEMSWQQRYQDLDKAHTELQNTCLRLAERIDQSAAREEGYRRGVADAAKVVDEHGIAWGLSYRSMTDQLSRAILALRGGGAS